MGALQRGNNAFQPGELKCGPNRFVICSTKKKPAACFKKMGMQGTNTRIIQTRGNTVRLHYLPVFGLHYQAFTAMQYTRFS